MIASTIWNQLIATLQCDDLSYIKRVYSGRRYDIDPNSLPCLMLEPVRDGEISKDFSNVQDIWLTANIFAFCPSNYVNFENSIVGNQIYKGIFDINNDVRAVLISSNTLGGKVIDISIQPSEFDSIEDKYPVRGLVMPIRVLYRQQNGV